MSAERRRAEALRAVSGHVARKRFGQHFLADRGILEAIVAAIAPQANDRLIEIGPGLGALTRRLLERVIPIAAVEIDRDLAGRLSPLVTKGSLQLFEADALSFDFTQAASSLSEAGQTGPVRVVGNLPYNISSPLLVHLLQFRTLIKDQHFLLQREVVERIVAGPGSSAYGRLGVLLQAFYEVAALFEVPPEAFEPPPRVQSAVVRLAPRAQPLIEDPRPLQRVLAEGFAQRRKMLRGHLLPWLEQQGVETAPLDPTLRPERIDVATWCDLARQLPN